ncbi:MAG: M48 family metallopeptidase [Rugosibacter sp.]
MSARHKCQYSIRNTIAMLATAIGTLCPPPAAHAQSFNLNAIFDTAKSLAKSQEVGSMSEEEEIAVGKEVVSATLGTYPPIKKDQLQHMLNQVGVWVALQSSRPHLPWRFVAVRSDSINAFAAPGGTIMVTQGMLKLVSNEAELACVLGHEIAHVDHRHHISVMQKSLLVSAGASALSIQSGKNGNADYRKQLVTESKEIFTRGLDRGSEREADEEGVLLAARAGYDPAACLNFMQRLAGLKADTGPLAALYKTHPSAKERATDINTALGKLDGASPGEGARPPLKLGLAQ